MKTAFFRLIFLFLGYNCCAQTGFNLYFIGDAGQYTIPGKALLMLKEELLAHPNSAVIFLGDNVYPQGLKLNDETAKAHLHSQLQILHEYKGKVYFIPGNHDWEAQKPNGLYVLKNQENYITDYLKNHSEVFNKNTVTFLPGDGLPGPETQLLNDKLRLIIIDTQWFLHRFKKNTIGTKKNTQHLFFARLDSLLIHAKQNQEQVVIAAHHPLFTNGQHARSKQPLRFLINYTPFKLFGLLGLDRLFSQDLAQPRYKKMRKKILNSLEQYSNILYASGHEHNLQCFKYGNNKFIVSGAGSKLRKLKKRKKFDSVFQDDGSTGFIKVEYNADGKQTFTIFREDRQAFIVEEF